MLERYFATGYVRLLYRLLQAERLTSDQLFQNTGCSEADLMRADFQMPFQAQMRFCQNALVHSPPGLGLQSGQQLQIAAHGALGTAMQSATDLHAAISAFAQLVAARASFYSLALTRQGQMAQVEITIHDLPSDLIPFFSESICFTIAHCVAFYSGRSDNRLGYRLNYAKPQYWRRYFDAFGDEIEFGCKQMRISFDAELLSLPSPEADQAIYAESVVRCRGQIHGRQHRDTTGNVENFLLENPGKLWTVGEIAPLFAVSSRTLIRRLKEAGTSYQSLRDDILKRQAMIYLDAMTVEAAAISLGFADTSSFRRTFKRWFGVNPSERL
ncbi:MAG: AraC family transcriptional regulator ligand-binding domain-containing protein [Pseudomonadales bacterium]